MSKAVVASTVVGVGGTGAAGVYGAHKAGWIGGSVVEDEKKPELLEHNEKRYGELYIAETKEKDLQKNNGGCIGHTFPGWKYGNGWESDMSDFSLDGESDKTKGCLAFNWDRKAEKEGEGSNFRFVWTFEQNGAGFVVHLSGTVQKAPTVKFEGVAYAMKKESDEWKVVRKMDLENNTISLGDDKNYFPKIDLSKIGKDVALNDYWGFLEDDGKKLKAGEESRRGRWEWIGDAKAKNRVKIDDSMSNVWVWWQHLFGEEVENDSKVFGSYAWLSDVEGNWKAY